LKFGREKRLWLGTLALLAPIPLPFNQVLEWPFLFCYALFVIFFLQRAESGSWTTLGNWALNLLGLGYMPVFYFDLRAAFFRGTAVTALLHLIMFLVVVKLFSIRREKDKWHIVVAIYFLFVGAMATSSHFSIVPYLGTFLVLGLLILGRFAHLHMMTGQLEERSQATSLPFRVPLTLGSLLVLCVAVPLFATVPRIREPYILGRGPGSGSMTRSTGFSDSVNLNITSSIRGNRNVALRAQYDDEVLLGDPGSLRFKGATYDTYRDRNWHRALRLAKALAPESVSSSQYTYRLDSDSASVNRAVLFLEPINSFSVILPMETLSITLEKPQGIGIDPGGAVLMPARPQETLRYEVALAPSSIIDARVGQGAEDEHSALDESGLTPRIRDLARVAMGEGGSPEERIDRLERHLLNQYSYTLDLLGRNGENPLEDFLFVYKSGHCEYFATAMVLMLRAEGIPARFVTGFLGAELNPIEDYFVVRQQNAHAWVEAFTEARGWQVYDPTPPDGRPTIAQQSLSLLLSQVYDYITFRWDRYVLTYGADDQNSFFRQIKERLQKFWSRIKGDGEESSEPETPLGIEQKTPESQPTPWAWQPTKALLLWSLLALSSIGSFLFWSQRRPLGGEAAYLLLRRRLGQAGLDTADSVAPLELQRRASERFSNAAAPISRIVRLYLRESFANELLIHTERQDLRNALKSLDSALREAHRAERQQRRTERSQTPAPAST